ncbi:branched-chain amino acid ABC transporter permease [Geomonas paludis]|uniref:Branched-chain amino acid ABC transporter permease n=1 Tax=Geomonas paludis TaxID=2740185 RepID=A0A6V8MT89_9BACT|nr:branched-chain amino acid ABC transporter permease [Geomonas paludis]UPU38170.1 branched-chain amino acid ABC transporter permease [Geomonas paludis]GFO63300.1 branched-chain amino acid ABC transporter permease [Geomonas paludis]
MKSDRIKFLVFALVVLLMPLPLSGGYLTNVLIFVGINSVLALGLNLLLGYAGQISLGQAAFFGLGAYGSGVLTTAYGLNPWLAMIAVAVCVALFAFAIGFPVLRLKGHYLAMATLGVGVIVNIAFNETVDLTGGPSGLSGIPNLSIGSLTFDSDLKNYYLVWVFALGMILLSLNLVNSRFGRGLRAIHDSEVAARVMGVNARLMKVQVFTLSAFMSAIMGSLYCHVMTFISPNSFGFHFSVELLTMIVIGGLGSVYGSILGALLLTMLPEMLRTFQDYDIIVYGLLLITMTIYLPGGLVEGIPALFRRLVPAKKVTEGSDA